MGLVKKNGMMELIMRELLKKVKKTVKVFTNGVMEVPTTAPG